MIGSRSTYTRTQILHAATGLFIRKGPDGTSLREITAEAGVNLSAVHYHFGSKEGLIQAVYQQQLDRLNRERLALLDQFETQANGAALDPLQVVKAFFLPLVRHAALHAAGNKLFMPLIERPKSSPHDFLLNLITNDQTGAIDRFRAALRKALPGMPEQEILWRLLFMLGATSCAISGMDGLPLALYGLHEPLDKERLGKRLVVFLTAGLQAPLPNMSEFTSDDMLLGPTTPCI